MAEVGDDDTVAARSTCTVWQKPPEAALRPSAVVHYDRFWKSRGHWVFRHRSGTMLLAGDLSAHLRQSPPAPIEAPKRTP